MGSDTATIGIHHRKKDFYSAESPIPSIQRFLKKGIAEVIRKGSDNAESEADSDDDLSSPTKAQSVSQQAGEGSVHDLDSVDANGESARPPTPEKRRKGLRRLLPLRGKPPDEHAQEDREIAEEAKRAHQSTKEANHQRHRRSHKARQVEDPVTGRNTWIKDVGRKEYNRAMEDMDRLHQVEVKRGKGDQLFGYHVRGPLGQTENVMTMPFPPISSIPAQIRDVHPLVLPLFLAWGVVTLIDLVPRAISVGLNAWLGWWIWRTLQNGAEDRRWERERVRGESARGTSEGMYHDQEERYTDGRGFEGITEGAEWLNGIIDSLWAVMNPELFSSLGSTLEDVMQASMPGFIHAVKVVDLAQGSTPLRLTGLRILPDKEVEDLRRTAQRDLRSRRLREKTVREPHEEEELERVDSGAAHEDTTSEPTPRGDGGSEVRGEEIRGEEDAGASFINVELGFIYRARPTMNDIASKNRNAHLMIKFWIGARKLYNIPLPVWVEIKGLVGRVRARIQQTPDPPFIKNVTFTFCGLPRVGVEVVPLRINTANLPFLSNFIQSSIDAALSEYVAPSSMTMDVGEMLMGDNIKREVNAVGVLVVYIHAATDLEKQDIRGSSDPYCTLSFAKFGKLQYATRVAINDLSPRWEERHVMTISPEAIRSKEKVSIALWDSDRFSSDDMLGRAEVDLVELVNRPGKLFRRSDTLVGLSHEMEKQGTIHWSLGFFAKTPNKRRQDVSEEEQALLDRSGEDLHGDRRMSQTPVHEEEAIANHILREEDAAQTRHQETAVQFEPPDPSLPCGILSMQIHQIANLECSDRSIGASFKRARAAMPGQSVDDVEDEEESSTAPSPYVTIIVNDETVFRSRTKALNTNPFFNAGTERFIRDWRRTLIMFVVHDFRLREADTILGVVPIKLSELFKETSQVTQFFPIAGGVGHGRIRLSLLFRPIMGMSRIKSKLGWNIGTVRLLSSPVAHDFVNTSGFGAHDLHLTGLRARTLAGSHKVAAHRARYTGSTDKSAIEWTIHDNEFPFRVPARRRYASPYVIEFRSINAVGKKKVVAMCIIWMQDLADDEVNTLRLPIYRPKAGQDFHRLRQNYHDFRNEDEAERLGVERVAYLEVKVQFKSGLGEVHAQLDENRDAKAVWQAWQCCVAAGLRDKQGDFAKTRINKAGYLEEEEAEVQLGEQVCGSASEDGDGSDDEDEDENEGGGREAKAKEGEAESRLAETKGDEGPAGEEQESRESMSSDFEGEDTDEDEDGEPEALAELRAAEANDKSDPRLRDKVKRWRQEKREMHRQHRGVKQFKAVRTASWIGSSAKDGGGALLRRMSLQDKRMGEVETEL